MTNPAGTKSWRLGLSNRQWEFSVARIHWGAAGCTWTTTLLTIMSRQQTWLACTISSSNNSRAFTSCSTAPGLFRQFACRWYISPPPCIISTFIWDQPSTVFCHKLAWIRNQYNWSELTSRRGSERRSLRKFMSSTHTFNIQSLHLAASIRAGRSVL